MSGNRKDYWSIPVTDVFKDLGTSEQGLSEQEARERLKLYGYNEIPTHAFSGVRILIRQFKNPLFFILLAAATVAGFFDLRQSIAIIVMIALSVVLGFYNEYRA